jgi:DNA (cytosine-5)-methyltransferase 1
MVGYAEIDPFACAVLAERCDATPPKYLADPDHRAIVEADYALSVRLSQLEGGARLPPRVLRHKEPGIDPSTLTGHDIGELWWREQSKAADMSIEEQKRRLTIIQGHRRHPVRKGGSVLNFGDLWYITDDDLEALGPVDMLEGGSPCQAFSAAGAKQGMTDHRSALMFAYLDLIERMKKINGLKWVLWENVKGVFRDDGNGFGYLLGALTGEQWHPLLPPRGKWANAGYVSGPGGQVAWRLLDSQYFGVPQRRERVFALAYVGDGPAPVDPRDVLFERNAESRGAAPGLQKDERKASVTLSGGSAEELVVFMAGQGSNAGSVAESRTTSPTLRATPSGSNQVPTVAYCLSMDSKSSWFRERTGTLLASAAHNPPVVVMDGTDSASADADPADPAQQKGKRYIVRKLMPVECERLQGFPDGWTDVAIGGKAPLDTWCYKALGNSMTVNVMFWIGDRLRVALSQARQDEAA